MPKTSFLMPFLAQKTSFLMQKLSFTRFAFLISFFVSLQPKSNCIVRNTINFNGMETTSFRDTGKDRINSAVVHNKDLIQSYILTTAKYDYTIYEKRILYRLIEMAQSQVEGHHFGNGGCIKIEPTIWGDQKFTFRTSFFLKDEQDENYTNVKKALDALSDKSIVYEDENHWEKMHIIEGPSLHKRDGTVDFKVDARVWRCILDFTKGYRKYQFETAFSFKSVYSMRFYELMSGQEKPLSFSLVQLKEMFQVGKKYSRINDFIRFVVEPAKKELDACSPYSFEYKPNKEGKKIVGFTFFPIYQQGYRDPELEKNELQRRVSLSWELDKKEIDYLKNTMLWPDASIRNNRDLLLQAKARIPMFLDVLVELQGKSRLMRNPIGYVVNALKGRLDDMDKAPRRGQKISNI